MDHQQDALRRLGQRLTELRQQKKLTAEQLSAATGLNVQEITAIEAGELDPPITFIITLCHALGVLPSELLRSP